MLKAEYVSMDPQERAVGETRDHPMSEFREVHEGGAAKEAKLCVVKMRPQIVSDVGMREARQPSAWSGGLIRTVRGRENGGHDASEFMRESYQGVRIASGVSNDGTEALRVCVGAIDQVVRIWWIHATRQAPYR